MSLRRSLLPIALTSSLLLAGCTEQQAEESPTAAQDTAVAVPASGHEDQHFDYAADSEHGPEHWGENAAWSRCSTGTTQSPIDVPAAEGAPLSDALTIDYVRGGIEALNNSHTVNVKPLGTNTVVSGGKTYRLAQLHLHADSEHELDGRASPLEAHLVHGLVGEDGEILTTQDADTGQSVYQEYLVLGVLLDEGPRDNPAWAAVLDPEVLPAKPAPDGEYAAVPGAELDPATLLPADRTAYAYSGSLTTPTPTCLEGVHWFVLTTPVEVSAEQIAAFTSIYENNSRPVQPH